MCIIVVKKKDIKMPSMDTLQTCFYHNPDGAGFMYVDNEEVVIEKGFMTWEAYKNRLTELNKEYNNFEGKCFVSHFRIGTQGKNDEHTCHPFPITSRHRLLRKTNLRTDVGMVHNGILSEYNSLSKYAKYLRWLYRRNLLISRGEEMNHGLIGKLNRQIRNYEAQN